MKNMDKERVKGSIRKELETIKLVDEVFDELGGGNRNSGAISVAKEHYLHGAVERMMGLCTHHTVDMKVIRQIANMAARMERIRYDAFRKTGFTKKEALAFCTGDE
ncbi:MAG: hypothetical protein L6243_04925 [Candidatus Altiarchaeales archaeon]|nr:hypothetical protein [Candidatus Altiarchaeales archaeon]